MNTAVGSSRPRSILGAPLGAMTSLREIAFAAITRSKQTALIKPYKAVLAVLLVALVLRAVGAIWLTGMIDTEGAEYARIAENWRAGAGYSGIATGGLQLFFPPLFPFLIASLSFLSGDAETAGRTISVIMGALLVAPVYLIARRMFGNAVALTAAVLVCVHPFLIWSSTTVMCENIFVTLFLTAMYLIMRAMEDPSPGILSAAGACYGLAYLVRPEALAFMFVGCGCLASRFVVEGLRTEQALWKRSLLVPLFFFIVAGPYVAWLSFQTGQLRFEGKSVLNLATEQRIQQGMSENEAAFAVGADLIARGVYNQPNINIIKSPARSMRDLIALLSRKAKSVFTNAAANAAAGLPLGSPALFGLAILGLFVRPWPFQLAINQMHIVVILCLVISGTFFTYTNPLRFYILFIPFLGVWASHGISLFARWARRTAAQSGPVKLHGSLISRGAVSLAVSAIILPSTHFAAIRFAEARREIPIKQATLDLIRQAPVPTHIADTSTPVAFSAKARFTWLPYCDEATALRFLARNGVTHVVVNDATVNERPYLRKWSEEGVPGAKPVVSIDTAPGKRFIIYQMAH